MTTILVVDDFTLARQLLRQILEGEGHQVIEANNSDSALDYCFRDRPQLVLLNLVMAGMSGLEMIQRLREIDQTVPIIVASANLQTLTHKLVKKAGAIGLIHKPFFAAQVLDVINTAFLEKPYEFDHQAR